MVFVELFQPVYFMQNTHVLSTLLNEVFPQPENKILILETGWKVHENSCDNLATFFKNKSEMILK